jgi:hypothetical protein
MKRHTLCAAIAAFICLAASSSPASAVNLNAGNADYVLSVYACDSDDFLIHMRTAGWVDVKTSVVGAVQAHWMMELAQELLESGKQSGFFTIDWTSAMTFAGYTTGGSPCIDLTNYYTQNHPSLSTSMPVTAGILTAFSATNNP